MSDTSFGSTDATRSSTQLTCGWSGPALTRDVEAFNLTPAAQPQDVSELSDGSTNAILSPLIGLVLAALLVGSVPVAVEAGSPQTQSRNDEHPACLQGILSVGEFFGPPRYGENLESNSIERSYYLQLPIMISRQQRQLTAIRDSKDALERTRYFVQLVIHEKERNRLCLRGRHRTPSNTAARRRPSDPVDPAME